MTALLFPSWLWLAVLLPGSPVVWELGCTVQVLNRLNEARSVATVELDLRQLKLTAAPERLRVRDMSSGQLLVTQLLDADGDQSWDQLLCQVALGSGERRQLRIDVAPAEEKLPARGILAFSRFVPERIDDYAWENDKVAFRSYGPVAQQLTEAGRKDGTLTSGMDCWLKRVPYPIIDKWYAGYKNEPNFYHQDRGEGYDPYHVGASRGCGGLGVWNDQDSILAVSKNFIGYKTLATGPIRTVFELTYAPWQAGGQQVRERKRISLDAGSHLSRYDVFVETDQGSLPALTVGITLHDDKGTVAARPEVGWFRYWEPMDNSELGTALLVAPNQVQGWWTYHSPRPDQSHVFVRLKPAPHRTYYAGFGWAKAGRIRTAAEWEAYLAAEARYLASPLEVSVVQLQTPKPAKGATKRG